MDLLKTALPAMDAIQMEMVFNQVFIMDIKTSLAAYEVEYHVIQEELEFASKETVKSPSPSVMSVMTHVAPVHEDATTNTHNDESGETENLKVENRNLKRQNMELVEQLQVSNSNVHSLESSKDNYKSTIKRLETRARTLEDERDALLQSLNMLRRRLEKLETTAELNQESIDSN